MRALQDPGEGPAISYPIKHSLDGSEAFKFFKANRVLHIMSLINWTIIWFYNLCKSFSVSELGMYIILKGLECSIT